MKKRCLQRKRAAKVSSGLGRLAPAGPLLVHPGEAALIPSAPSIPAATAEEQDYDHDNDDSFGTHNRSF